MIKLCGNVSDRVCTPTLHLEWLNTSTEHKVDDRDLVLRKGGRSGEKPGYRNVAVRTYLFRNISNVMISTSECSTKTERTTGRVGNTQ